MLQVYTLYTANKNTEPEFLLFGTLHFENAVLVVFEIHWNATSGLWEMRVYTSADKTSEPIPFKFHYVTRIYPLHRQ